MIHFFFFCKFFALLVIKTLHPDWILIRIGIQPKMQDPDPDSNESEYCFLITWQCLCRTCFLSWTRMTVS